MHAWLESLTNSSFGQWVLVSPTGYPVLLSIHSIGLAVVVGLLVMIDLRILGLARAVPLPAFDKLLKVVWLGFWANALSGLAIFVSDAVRYYESTTFRIKILSVVLGLVFLALIKSTVIAPSAPLQSQDAPPRAKLFAVLSLLSWLVALVAGRLMAYVD